MGRRRPDRRPIERDFAVRVDAKGWLAADENLNEDGLRKRVARRDRSRRTRRRCRPYGAPVVRHLEKAIMLQQLDSHWREHLAAMDYLRQGIHLRSYAQKNPKQEYKREAFELFTSMLDRIKHDTVSLLSRMQLRRRRRSTRKKRSVSAVWRARCSSSTRRPASHVHRASRRRVRSPSRSRAPRSPVAQFVRETEESRPQRTVPVRLRQEVQALPRRAGEAKDEPAGWRRRTACRSARHHRARAMRLRTATVRACRHSARHRPSS